MKSDPIRKHGVASDETGQSVLAVIDMQHAFRDKASQWYIPRYDQAAAVIERLRDALTCRRIYTRFVPDLNEEGAWRSYYDYWEEMRRPAHDPVWVTTLDIGDTDSIVDAGTFGKWSQIAPYVALGDTLIICGVATECCVLSTVLGAIDAGRRVVLVPDACAAINDEAQAGTLTLLSHMFPLCHLVDSEQLLPQYKAE